MKDYLKKTTDAQTPVAVRFGKENDDGTTEWGERQDIRILIADGHGQDDDWCITPLSLDGRPMNMTFVGSDVDDGTTILREQNTDHVLQILKISTPSIVRLGVNGGDLPARLDTMEMGRKDLSPLGKAIYDAVTEFEDQIPQEFVERMLEEMPNFHGD